LELKKIYPTEMREWEILCRCLLWKSGYRLKAGQPLKSSVLTAWNLGVKS